MYFNDDFNLIPCSFHLFRGEPSASSKKPSSNKDAAKSVDTKNSRSKPQSDEQSTYLRESQVHKMSPQEYEKHSDEIMEAIRSGKFIYDMSGSAR